MIPDEAWQVGKSQATQHVANWPSEFVTKPENNWKRPKGFNRWDDTNGYLKNIVFASW